MTIQQLVEILRSTQTAQERQVLEAERDRWRREGVLPSYLAGLKEVEE